MNAHIVNSTISNKDTDMSLSDEERKAIVEYLTNHGVMATAMFFRRSRITIRRICIEYGICPQKDAPGRKTHELTMAQLHEKWEKQEKCKHEYWIKRCSICGKAVESDSKKVL